MVGREAVVSGLAAARLHRANGLRTRRRSNWCGETRVHREVSVRVEELASLGWTIVRVAAESAPDDVVRRSPRLGGTHRLESALRSPNSPKR